jgi:hypothetical protein
MAVCSYTPTAESIPFLSTITVSIPGCARCRRIRKIMAFISSTERKKKHSGSSPGRKPGSSTLKLAGTKVSLSFATMKKISVLLLSFSMDSLLAHPEENYPSFLSMERKNGRSWLMRAKLIASRSTYRTISLPQLVWITICSFGPRKPFLRRNNPGRRYLSIQRT